MSPRLATLLFSRLSELDTKEGPGCNDETDREPQENPDQHHNTCISARVLRFESVCRCLRADRYGGVDGRITRRREAPNDKPYENSGPENPSEFTDNTELSNNVDRENEAKWAARLVGAGSLLTLVYETAFLVLDRRFLSLSDPPVLIFSFTSTSPSSCWRYSWSREWVHGCAVIGNRWHSDAAQTVARVRELGMRRVAGRKEAVQLAEIVD
jgi:hypothetical protein